MSNLKKLITAAGGAHGVFLAVRHDENLAGTITRTQKGTLQQSGKPLGDNELANILVYLTGTYGIKPSKWELMSGLVAASQKTRRNSKRKPPPQDFINKVDSWLQANGPSARNLSITTERIAVEISPDEFEANRRGAEMKVAAALRSLGLHSKRMMVGGVRHYRWFPTKTT